MIVKYLFLTLGLISNFGPGSATSVDISGATLANLTEMQVSTLEFAPLVVKESLDLWVTAYSSTPEETDDSPFITASGSVVRDGIVATNLLPFGTKVKIPAYFGDKIFTVEDRMHSRKIENIDIWMPSKEQALRFGIARAEILVLE